MGAQVSQQRSEIQNTLRQKLSLDADATAECQARQQTTIYVGGDFACTLNVKNECYSSTSIDIDQMAKAVAEIAQEAASENEMSGIALLQTNVNIQDLNQMNERIADIASKCNAKSDAELDQSNQITIGGDCAAGTELNFINVGDAKANCVLAQAQEDFLYSDQTSDSKNLMEGIDPMASAMSFLAPCIVCVGVCIVIPMVFGSVGSKTSGGQQPRRTPVDQAQAFFGRGGLNPGTWRRALL